MKNDVEQRTVNLQHAVVGNKTQLPEPVHEKANPGSGGADHFRQHLLTDLGDYRLGFAFLAKMSK